jgi:hypothetical protein
MNATIEKFQKQQIEKANFIKEKANNEIALLEAEIVRLKEQIKSQQSIIKQADKDIKNYSE